ncbi:MAG: nucleotidyltransferase domain-containing protein [Bacteroidales bacterium]|nr:nucleotidyltransferase domain-containing protein [Bacteroidales bacterium]
MSIIERNIGMIMALCEKHKVRSLSVFGSVLTDRFNDESDVDFVVDFAAMDIADYADNYLNMQMSLSQLLGREVDLLEDKAIRNPILRQNIDRTKQVIYG